MGKILLIKPIILTNRPFRGCSVWHHNKSNRYYIRIHKMLVERLGLNGNMYVNLLIKDSKIIKLVKVSYGEGFKLSKTDRYRSLSFCINKNIYKDLNLEIGRHYL